MRQLIQRLQAKTRSTHGASVTEYAVLMALLGLIILGSVFAMGGGVRDTLAWLNGSVRDNVPAFEGPASSTPVASEPIASTPEEPREGRPLVMTFTGNASFQAFQIYAEQSNELFPNPRIDWGPMGGHCNPNLVAPESYMHDGHIRSYWTDYPQFTYACNLGPGDHKVRVYAPLYLLTRLPATLKGVDDWGDVGLWNLDRAFSHASNLEYVPSDLPPRSRGCGARLGASCLASTRRRTPRPLPPPCRPPPHPRSARGTWAT